MAHETMRITIFLDKKDYDTLRYMYGKDVERTIERIVKDEVAVRFTKILNRCSHCGKEIFVFIKRARAKEVVLMRKLRDAKCNKCNPRSSWRRVEDVN